MAPYPHLSLGAPFSTGDRRRRPGGGGGPQRPDGRQPATFAAHELDQAASIEREHRRKRARFSAYLDPKLIFRLETNQAISPDELQARLQGARARPLYIPPRGEGSWILFADEHALSDFKNRLEEHGKSERYGFFDAVEGIHALGPDDRLGPRLRARLAEGPDNVTADIELWRTRDAELEETVAGMRRFLEAQGGTVLDTLFRRSFAQVKVRAAPAAIRELLELDEIAFAELPPQAPGFRPSAPSVQNLEIGPPPRDDAPGVVVLDSGVASAHPVLEPCIRHEFSHLRGQDPSDDTGHGTAVASIAAYGDLAQAAARRRFTPSVWLHSHKVMHDDGHGGATYDDESLLTRQVQEAVATTMANFANTRIFVLALGDPAQYLTGASRQFPLAAVVDELSHDYDIVFVCPTGNSHHDFPLGYPDSLLLDGAPSRIINPGSAALAITVGSYFEQIETIPPPRGQQVLFDQTQVTPWPSRFTRSGPGINGMVKPDVIEFGGANIAGMPNADVTVARRQFLAGQLFEDDYGTSFSAPLVAHHLARIIAAYPGSSTNLAKALLLLNAQIPARRPGQLATWSTEGSAADFENLTKVYGWGVPNVESSLVSDDRRVVFTAEASIGLDQVHAFSLRIPAQWFTTAGNRRVRVSLASNPPTAERGAYLGLGLDFAMFVGTDADDIARRLSQQDEDAPLPADLEAREIKFHPGPQLRNRGAHQVATAEYSRRPRTWGADDDVVVVVRCKDRWVDTADFTQPYAVAVQVEHEAFAELFAQARVLNQAQLRARARA